MSPSYRPLTLLFVDRPPSIVVKADVPNCARNYTVVAGDTCDGICAKENVSSFQLASVNNATINAGCTNLVPGEVKTLRESFQSHSNGPRCRCCALALSARTAKSPMLWPLAILVSPLRLPPTRLSLSSWKTTPTSTVSAQTSTPERCVILALRRLANVNVTFALIQVLCTASAVIVSQN